MDLATQVSLHSPDADFLAIVIDPQLTLNPLVHSLKTPNQSVFASLIQEVNDSWGIF